MFRNVFLKKILKTNFFPIFSLLNKFVPKSDKKILIYSANKGIGHSLIPLRQYLQNQGFGQKYRIICGIESLKYKDEGPWEFVMDLFTLKACILFSGADTNKTLETPDCHSSSAWKFKF